MPSTFSGSAVSNPSSARTLYQLLLSLAEYCLPKQSGEATSGSTTTLVDSVRKQSPGGFTNGILFINTGTHAGKFFAVTTYDGTTGTFTFPAVTGAIAAGVQYEAFEIKAGANMYDLIAAVNQALRDLGEVPSEDATLTTVADQEEYNLPATVANVIKVEVARDTASPYDYQLHTHWDEMGTVLRFPRQFLPAGNAAGYKIRLTCMAAHGPVDTYDDIINRHVNWKWLVYQSAINLFEGLANRGKVWDEIKRLYEKAEQRIVRLRPLDAPILIIKGT